jgi:hypothetical protein
MDSLMAKIYSVLHPDRRYLRVQIYPNRTVDFLIWEWMFPLTVDLRTKQVYASTYGTDCILNAAMVAEMMEIMVLINNAIFEIDGWVGKGGGN